MRRRRFTPLMMLAAEANTGIPLRIMKLMVGGRSAHREAERMVTEKVHAAFEAGASLVALGNDIIHRYKQDVRNGGQEKQGAKTTARPRVLKLFCALVYDLRYSTLSAAPEARR
jgi:hypothetical protein